VGEIPGSAFEGLLPDTDAEGLNADIVDVVGLIKNHHALLLHLLGDDAGHFWVEKVLVAVDHHVGVADHLAGQEVGAPALVAAKGAEVAKSVDTRGEQDGLRPDGGGTVIGLKEGAGGGRSSRVVLGEGADPGGSEAAAGSVDGVTGAGREDGGVDTEVLAGGEAEGEEGGAGRGGEVIEQEAELSKGFLHLMHGAGAVEELEVAVGVGEGVGDDEGEQSRRLAGASGHLEEGVAAGVEGALEVAHVLHLLGVDAAVGEVHRHAIHVQLHSLCLASCSPLLSSLPFALLNCSSVVEYCCLASSQPTGLTFGPGPGPYRILN
jgi:hypothetical protein